jgi:tetratricopeptide (TPR) repeat protein
LAIDPEFADANKNLAITLRDAGRQAGEVENNLTKAEALLTKSYNIFQDDTETLRLLGVANGIKGNHQGAITYFQKVVALDPKSAGGFLNLGNAYKNAGDMVNGEKYIQQAVAIDPNILNNQGK